jgi:hypothetical protein
MDLNREETTGTLQLLGLPVLTGLYAQTAEHRQAWMVRVPTWLRWACSFRWYATWTTPQEERDAIGRAIARGAPPPSEADHLCGLLRQVAARHEPPND